LHTQQLRQERRRNETFPERRAQIDATLAQLEAIGSQFAFDMRNYMSSVRAENDGLRDAVWSGLANDGELEHLYTIRWTVRQIRRGMQRRLPVFQEEPSSRRHGKIAASQPF
jgi:hypothetical protein